MSGIPLQGNVESLQTMLSDPESIVPALPLEISFPADQVWPYPLTPSAFQQSCTGHTLCVSALRTVQGNSL